MKTTKEVYVKGMFTDHDSLIPELRRGLKPTLSALVIPHIWVLVAIVGLTTLASWSFDKETLAEKYPNEVSTVDASYTGCVYSRPEKLGDTSGVVNCEDGIVIQVGNTALYRVFDDPKATIKCNRSTGNVTGRRDYFCYLNNEDRPL